MKISTITATLLLVASTAAHAGGIAPSPVAEAPVATLIGTPAPNWGGFYAGLSYGINELNARQTTEDISTAVEGNALGVFLGYNHQYRQAVFGIEMSYNQAADATTDTPGNIDSDDNILSQTKLKGRIGYDAGRFMPYAMIGLGKFDMETNGDAAIMFSQMTYGAGVDFAVTPHFIVGIEYSAFQSDELNTFPLSADANSVEIRASYRF